VVKEELILVVAVGYWEGEVFGACEDVWMPE